MANVFEVINGVVTLTPSGELVPQFKNLKKHFKKSSDYEASLSYIYNVYDRASSYADVLPIDRKKMVCSDVLKESDSHWEYLEGLKAIKDAVDWFEYIQRTAKERLFYGVDQKVEEYIDFWKTVKIDEKNHNIVSDSVANAAKLVKLRDDLEKQIFKNTDDAREVGGGKAKLFEG